MNYSLGRIGDPVVREHIAHCQRCQKRLQDMEEGLFSEATEDALPNAPLAPGIELIQQKSLHQAGKSSSKKTQKQKRPAQGM